MRNILIPTDFSDNATNAINFGLNLFKYDICVFYFLHTYQDELYSEENQINRENFKEVEKRISDKSLMQLQDLIANLKKTYPNPKFSYRIISANSLLVDEIDKIVEEEDIDIIVMGTQGKTNNKMITFGSNTLQVLKYVSCPVLAIPEHYTYNKPKHILFPTNYLIPYKRRELKLLCEMACPYRAKIDMLYVSNSNKLSLRQEDNKLFIKDTLCKNETNFLIINSNNITETINTFVNQNKIDMLVMVNTRHSHLENILFQSKLDEISLNSKIPLLAFQNIEREIH
ncbi:universal stress protein [Gaetbulibacter sp. M235]|uniref:universal stress protein n=1 Tax=Gaetbulibacter sp. M235 TaxID=3126510 RepID=UPI00374EB12B